MINRITVSEKRGLFPEYSSLGTIGEKNATTLLFLLPSSLQGYNENIVCETAQGSFSYTLSNDTFDLPSEVLTDSTLKLQLVLKDGDKVIWKSIPYTFTLNPTLDDSGENVIEKAKTEQREADRTELGKALKEATGEDYEADNWEKLIENIGALIVLTDENKSALENNKHISFLFERSTQPPSILYGDYAVADDEASDYIDSDGLVVTPYLDTPNALYSAGTKFSEKISNVEINVSGVDNSGFNKSSGNTSSVFWLSGTNVKKMVLMGSQNIANMAFLFSNSPVEELTLLETGEKRENVTYKYGWEWTFNGCSNLKYILGTPLDITRSNGSSGFNMFAKCTNLRYVGFKPKTITGTFNMGACSQLTKSNMEAIISLLNGCRDWINAETASCSLTLNSACKDDLKNQKCHCNKETGEYISHNTYLQSSEEDQKNYGAEVDYIAAFTHQGTVCDSTTQIEVWYKGKGVTLAWS
ncbi:MAG TPA: hypothetical protein DD393_05550 [Ruminococcaceae bacterium]|nr:hypothetical protein [Oscillospiraceae bacterium]